MSYTNDGMSLYSYQPKKQDLSTTPEKPYTLQDVRFEREIYLPNASYFSRNLEKMDENKQSEKESKETIPKLVRHFLGYTTAHGFSRLGDSKGVFWRVFWSLVCLGSFGMFTYQVHGLFTKYLSRPVTTSVRITFEKQVPFPAVTICNLNMLRTKEIPQELKKEMLQLVGLYNGTAAQNNTKARRRRRRDIATKSPSPTKPPMTTYRSSTWHTTKEPYKDTTWHQTTSNSHQGTTYRSYKPSSGTHFSYNYKDYTYVDRDYLPSKDEVKQDVLFLERFTTAVTKVPVDILAPAGHQFHDLVTECTWRGYDCKNSTYANWWVQSWHYKYGNCYTFNGGIDYDHESIRVLSTSKPGPSQGLSLRLDIQQEEYLKYVSDEAGVRVKLHDQGMMPFPYLEGFSVGPGMSTSVGLHKTVISRVDRFSNNTCWNIDGLDEDNIYRLFQNITKYTQQTCHNSCVGKTQLQECGCSEYSYPSNISACDAFNQTIRKCLFRINSRFNNDQLPCIEECKQPCRENVIQKTISMSQWPSTPYHNYEKEKNINFSPQNSLLLNIFYNELNFERIEESFVYDEINLLADIGGQLGLWIGVSVITVFEVIELFVLIITRVCGRRKKKETVHNVEEFP